jgi:hypothetical protein
LIGAGGGDKSQIRIVKGCWDGCGVLCRGPFAEFDHPAKNVTVTSIFEFAFIESSYYTFSYTLVGTDEPRKSWSSVFTTVLNKQTITTSLEVLRDAKPFERTLRGFIVFVPRGTSKVRASFTGSHVSDPLFQCTVPN